MARDTTFRRYLMTEPLVSVATRKLIEHGRVLLSDPVAKYQPDFATNLVA